MKCCGPVVVVLNKLIQMYKDICIDILLMHVYILEGK